MEEKIKERIKMIQLQNETKRTGSRRSLVDSESINEGDEQRMKKTGGKWGLMKKVEARNPEIKKRNEISRKMQLTYSYYKT